MRHPRAAVGLICAAAIVITGCAPERPLGAVADTVAAATDTVTFDRSPTAFGDGFVAVRYPDEESADLTFVVTDGKSRWDVHTNPACAGFAITRADNEDLLVVLDSDASVTDGQLATTTVATAFRTDGTVAWGPEPVTGALSDSGLITTRMLGGALSSEHPPTTALSPSTGSALHLPPEERAVYAAYGLLAAQTPDGVLVRDAAAPSTPVLWRSEQATPPEATGPATIADAHGITAHSFLVLEWPTVRGPLLTVHHLTDGTLLAALPGQPDARTLVTPEGNVALFTTATTDARTVTAVSSEQGRLWTDDLPAGSVPVSETAHEVWFTAASGYLHRTITNGSFESTDKPGPLLVLRSGYEVRYSGLSREYRLRPTP